MLDKIVTWIIYSAMPLVAAYHTLCSSVFLNTTREDTKGLEKVADQLLAPTQYILCGKIAILEDNTYFLRQRFDYQDHFFAKTALSALSLPITLPLGIACKAVAYVDKGVRRKAYKVRKNSLTQAVYPNIDFYQEQGISFAETPPFIPLYSYERGEEEKIHLQKEKELLQCLSQIFQEKEIPFWIDCGTCLGMYRYGGAIPWDNDVDIAALMPDFDNIWNALKALDQSKYKVQDWSNRSHPNTYIRVYVTETHNHVDIYFFEVDPEKRSVQYFLSNFDSFFMLKSWKEREKRFTIASSYDTLFPLRRAVFDGISVFVPQNIEKYLQERYGENLAPNRIYNKATGVYEKDLSHPYWQIPGVY